MQNVETLKAIYEERQAKYNALCDAYSQALVAANEIKAMCETAMADMHKAGQDLIEAMSNRQ